LNEPFKKDLLVDPASNFQTSVCLPKISVNITSNRVMNIGILSVNKSLTLINGKWMLSII
jgi:hypothetical protein